MEELINNAGLMAVVLAPITTGVIQVIKQTFTIDHKYLPVISLLVGVVIAALIAVLFDQDLSQFLLVGIIGGLSSAGLYDQKKITEERNY